jgi:ubiquinol oxidase
MLQLYCLAPQVGRRAGCHAFALGSLNLLAPRRACRGLSSTSCRLNDLTDPNAKAAAVGPHKRMLLSSCKLGWLCAKILTGDLSSPPRSVTASGDISHQNNGHHGDWVLFHPVYTPEELKAVEVRLSIESFGGFV